MNLIRIYRKLSTLLAIALLITTCGQDDEEECNSQEPVLVQVGDELFKVPIDSEIFISLESTRKGGTLSFFCLQGEPPYELSRLGVNGDSSLLRGADFVNSYKILQFWIYPISSPKDSLNFKYSSFKRRNPEVVVEDLPVEGSFRAFYKGGGVLFS